MARTLTASDRKALTRLASTLEKGSDERRAILSFLKKEGMDFKRIDRYMINAAEEMGSLLYGNPDVALKIRDALGGPYKKSARALFDAYEKAQAKFDFANDYDYDFDY